jgi:hypothetical protein
VATVLAFSLPMVGCVALQPASKTAEAKKVNFRFKIISRGLGLNANSSRHYFTAN